MTNMEQQLHMADIALDVVEKDKSFTTESYMKVWNHRHNLQRKQTLDYAAEMVAVKVAYSDMCLESVR